MHVNLRRINRKKQIDKSFNVKYSLLTALASQKNFLNDITVALMTNFIGDHLVLSETK
jgi:hypothetical protein